MSAKITRLALPAVLAVAVTLTGCGGSKPSSSTPPHPLSPVHLQIVRPTANQVTPPDITLVVNVIGGTVVPAAQTKVTGKVPATQGHIHVSLDGTLVNMAYSTTQDLKGLKPGQHTLTAEYVAVDHIPFKNRPTAVVIFMVQ